MAKKNKDVTEKVEKKLKDFQFKSPEQAKNPKLVEKKLKEVFKEKDKKEDKKVDKEKKANLVKKVVAKLKNN